MLAVVIRAVLRQFRGLLELQNESRGSSSLPLLQHFQPKERCVAGSCSLFRDHLARILRPRFQKFKWQLRALDSFFCEWRTDSVETTNGVSEKLRNKAGSFPLFAAIVNSKAGKILCEMIANSQIPPRFKIQNDICCPYSVIFRSCTIPYLYESSLN